MPSVRSSFILLLGLGIVFTLTKASEAANTRKRFTSEIYGFAAEYPADWYLDPTRSADSLAVESFSPLKAVRAVHLPSGGAEIMLTPIEAIHGRQAPRTLEQWNSIEMRRGVVTGTRVLDIGALDHRLSVTEVRKQCCAVPPFFESVDWYFDFHGRPFGAELLYWKDDPNMPKLTQTLQDIVLSLEFLGSSTPRSKH